MEILFSKFLHFEYRIALAIPIFSFAIIYTLSETMSDMTMLGKSFMLRAALILLFTTAAIILRMVRHARNKKSRKHESSD